MPILADALEEAGCLDADIVRHCRETGTVQRQTMKAGTRCPKCGKPGRWRSGVHFDNEKICTKCDFFTWEPGEDVEVEVKVPAVHVRGCWVGDLILGES